MKQLSASWLVFVGITLSGFLSIEALAASPDGAKIPGISSIIDAQNNTWTVVGAVIKKGGATVGNNYNVAELRYIGGSFYQKNTSNEWYLWNGSSWLRGSSPLVASASGASIGSTGHLIDNQTPEAHVWSIQSDILYVDGLRADGNYNTTKATYENNLIYCENTSSEWYEWVFGTEKWVASSAPSNGGSGGGGTSSGTTKYLSQLGAKCNGSDDTAAVQTAVTNAQNGAYTLVIDCAATLNIGVNVDKSIYINNGTTINFEKSGQFIVNNLFVPAFVIANSTNITLNDWNVSYTAAYQTGSNHTMNYGMPISFSPGGYYLGGNWNPLSTSGLNYNGAGAFNDVVYTAYLEKNKGLKWTGCAGSSAKTGSVCRALFTGTICESSVFFIAGETSNVQINSMNLHASEIGEVTRYIPFGFMFATGFKSNQTISNSTPFYTATNAHDYYATPNNVTLNGVTIDGYMMGFQGALSNSKFENIKALHYSDLQDVNGNNVGGIVQNGSATMPPPHLFYLDDMLGEVDATLANTNVTISNVTDAYDPTVSNPVSLRGPNSKYRQIGGYSDAIKFQCNSCSIAGFTSYRADGFMSIMAANNLKVSNVTVNYNSLLVNNNYQSIQGTVNHWHAVRTTASVANGITFSNVTLNDTAATTATTTQDITGKNITLSNVNFECNKWNGSGAFAAGVPGGTNSGSGITFITRSPASRVFKQP